MQNGDTTETTNQLWTTDRHMDGWIYSH